ncbi:MAG: L-tyrosine/L-tryptophan isonitrile synthase family protein, partial [Corynebacteriales bacterium]|nr:L-tyrosine/L-tryptophan isonitrile synthase family protein [Mycobacteriales bacterium]
MSENESNNPHQLVIDALEIHRQRRRADPNLGKAAVVIDLDACGLDARTRTINAVKATGRHYVISEFSRPGELATLPTDNPKVWQNFLVTNGLLKKYPDMDWDAVRKDFSANYWREPGNDPYLHLRTDQFAAGLWEYTKVVRAHDAEVVFLSGRSERHRLHSEHTLNAGGAGPYRLLIKPDQGEVDTAQNKVDNLLAVSDQTAPEPLVPVVIIDDLTENREAVKAAFPDIIAIHMALPGYAADHLPGQRPADGAPVVSDFLGGVSRPKHTGRLSYLTSMSKVLFGVENSPPLARGAEISGGEMENHLLSLVRRSLREARDVGAAHADRGDLADSVHRVLTHKMFRRGPRTNFEVGEFRAQLAALGIGYGSDVAIPAGIIGFPIKFEGLKAKGTQPDLAEFGGLLRLKQIATAVREVYPDGMRIEILTDGTHFRSRDDSLVDSYLDQLERYRALIDPEGDLVIEDFDAAVARHLKDPGLP